MTNDIVLPDKFMIVNDKNVPTLVEKVSDNSYRVPSYKTGEYCCFTRNYIASLKSWGYTFYELY